MAGFDVATISVHDAAALLKERPSARLIDVRTEEEFATARIPGAVLAAREAELEKILALPKETPLIVHCHHGVRSIPGAGFFIQRGFTEVYSLSGGIDAWSCAIDPSIPRY
jgi:monothiol glutaredoxin